VGEGALERLSVFAKAALVAEILVAYVPALRRVRRNDLRDMVDKARDVQRPGRVRDGLEHAWAVRLGWITMKTLGVLPTDKRCLIRSLVVLRLLARRSIAATLVIGVRPGPDFLAHAWVEHDGLPVLPTERFVPLHEL
jgi:hypothetical protein